MDLNASLLQPEPPVEQPPEHRRLSDSGSDAGDDRVEAEATLLRPSTESLGSILAELQFREAKGNRESESLDFDTDYDLRRRYLAGDSETKRCWGYSGASLTQWVLTVVLGVTVGLVAFVMKQGIEEVQIAKLGYIELLLNPCTESADACAGLGEQEQRERIQPTLALGVFCGVNAALGTSQQCYCTIDPHHCVHRVISDQ